MFKKATNFSFEHTLDAVIGIDGKSCVIEWNKKAEEYFGWSRAEVMSKDISDIIIPERYREQHRKGMKHFLKTGEGPILNKRVEVSALRRDGTEFEVELAISPIEANGDPLFYAHLRDISLQKRTAQRLATQNEVMSILVEGQSPSEVTPKILKSIATGLGFNLGIFWPLAPGNQLSFGEFFSVDDINVQSDFFKDLRTKNFSKGTGAPGRAWDELGPIWITDIQNEKNFPRAELATQEGFKSGAWFPVLSKNSFYGVFEFLSKNRQAIDDELVITFIGLGQQIGQFLEKQSIMDSLARRNFHSEFLADLSKKFTEISDDASTEQILQQFAQFLVPDLCDWCTVRLKTEENGQISNIAIAHVNPEKAKWAWELTSKYPRSGDSRTGPLAVIQSGRSEFFPIIPEKMIEDAAVDATHLSLLKEVGFYSWACVPLNLEDQTIGALSLVSTKESHRVFSKEDLLFAEELARRAATIIETRRLNLKTKEAERNLRLITDAVPALISYVGRDEIYKFVNKAYEDWFGTPREKIIGKNVKSILEEESYNEIKPKLSKVFKGESATHQMLLPHTKGGARFVSVNYVPDRRSDGKVYGYVALVQDITTLEKAKKEAQIANKAKTEFLANMSHEIRTPLGAILGFSELMIDSSQSPSDRLRWSSKIKTNGEHLLRLISDILDLSKIESGKIEVEKEKTSLIEVFQNVIGMFEPHSKEKGILLNFSVKEKIPNYVITDSVKLKQILINVIGNAVKFTQNGEVSVEASYSSSGGKTLYILVRDTGPGLTKDQSEKIFEPFVQGDSSATRKFEGTGLGLALARSLAVKLGGNVDLQKTTADKGTEFLISIQAEPSVDASFIQSIPVQNGHFKEERKREFKILSGVKVLVVDDLSDNQLLVSVFLRRAGASVVLASSGLEAIDKALSDNFDIILMDVQMPELDGHEATRRLRQHGYIQPIIALTAHALKEEIEKSLEVGCNAHITKPIVPEKLISTIDQLVH